MERDDESMSVEEFCSNSILLFFHSCWLLINKVSYSSKSLLYFGIERDDGGQSNLSFIMIRSLSSTSRFEEIRETVTFERTNGT